MGILNQRNYNDSPLSSPYGIFSGRNYPNSLMTSLATSPIYALPSDWLSYYLGESWLYGNQYRQLYHSSKGAGIFKNDPGAGAGKYMDSELGYLRLRKAGTASRKQGYPFIPERNIGYLPTKMDSYGNNFWGNQLRDSTSGALFMSQKLRVEPSMPRRQTGRSCKVIVRSLPTNINWNDFDRLVAQFGDLLSTEQTGYGENTSAVVTYKSPEDAQNGVSELNGLNYCGMALRANFYVDKDRSRPQTYGRRGGNFTYYDARGPSSADVAAKGRGTAAAGDFVRVNAGDMPLRMAVDARYVGAIIGQGGSNIRQITTDSKARCVVDVNRGLRDAAGNMEKVINIYGMPENSSRACVKILEVVERESAKEAKNEKTEGFELKMRAHNNLMGRLIGKSGSTIKRVMEDTGTTIYVSNISELNAFNMERTVVIKGRSLEAIGQAEQRISAKLRQCWEHDMHNTPASIYASGAPHAQHSGLLAIGHPQQGGYNHAPQSYTPSTANHQQLYQQNYYPQQQQLNRGVNDRQYNIEGVYSQGGQPHQQYASPSAVYYASGGGGHASQQILPQWGGVGKVGVGTGGVPTMRQMGFEEEGVREVVNVYVPNAVVGALIGARGMHIRNVMRMTGAHVRVETNGRGPPGRAQGKGGRTDARRAREGGDKEAEAVKGDESDSDVGEGDTGGDNSESIGETGYAKRGGHDGKEGGRSGGSDGKRWNEGEWEGSEERVVTITGTTDQQYKVQLWVYQVVAEQCYGFLEDVRLCAEMVVPSRLVGRIIGKGGQNVRELQRVTGAQIKIPDPTEGREADDTSVRIIAAFNASQAVQNRIRQLLVQYHSQASQSTGYYASTGREMESGGGAGGSNNDQMGSGRGDLGVGPGGDGEMVRG